MLGLILALYMYTKAASFLKDYPTTADRLKLTESLGSNVGVEALLGLSHKLNTLGGFMEWNFLCLITAVGAIWAMIYATKVFRGEEESGRTELFLGGQTTLGRLTKNLFVDFGYGLILNYLVILLGLVIIGHLSGANLSTPGSIFFALALIFGAAEFLVVGALASQLMPTRSRALGLSATVFGIFYLIRIIADASKAHWLLNLSPLGWIEKLSPMYADNSIWIIPIALFNLILGGLTIFIASHRDLNDALLADKDEAKKHTGLLNSSLGLTFRMNRAVSAAWLLGLGISAFVYSLLAKDAVQSLGKSQVLGHSLRRLSISHSSQLTTLEFMGIVFLIVILMAMFYAASAVSRIREDEAKAYLDNFLVRPVSRIRWLSGRILMVLIVTLLGALIICLGSWSGQAAEHSGLAFHTLLLASVNAMVPVLFVVAAGIFTFGLLPRLTGSIVYIVIGWSFLITMLSSGININHWLLDTSLLHQIVLAPAVSINWAVNIAILSIAAALAIIGALRFNYRDIEGE